MDEILFHISQILEGLQVHLHSGAQHGRHLLHNYSEQMNTYAVDVWSGLRCVQIWENIQHAWQWLLEFSREMKRLSLHILNPQQMYNQLLQFLGAEISWTNMYFGCVGFVLGGVLGVAVGFSWQRNQPNVQRMKAVVCNSYKGFDALMMIEDAPVPVITMPDEVLVQVKAASVDLVDIKICSGYGRVLRKQLNQYNHNVTGEFPVVLGRDCAGVIIEIGQKVKNFETGDEVWFVVPYWMQGTMAEYVVINESHIARKPKGIGFEIAASIPYAGTVAWDALVNQAHIHSVTADGKRILVHMGCSPIGCILIQLARLWGAHVTATTSLRATPVVQALGAHVVVVCGKADVQKQLAVQEGFDIIFNTEGSVAYEPCLKFCKPGGSVITTETSEIASDTYGFFFGSIYAFWIRIRCLIQGPTFWRTYNMGPAVLDQLARLLEDGSLQPVVDKIFAPQDAELAFQHAESFEAIGKTIIRFRSQRLLKSITTGKKYTLSKTSI
ncbi:reticulon-4-interacting protein 1 homolog, mitochondrial-like isoform X2 [Zootermopsis nevadensis]|uniref:Reticulon-4-interacting protein 1-like protein, mitochondrial n=1 Tax=Zootermopsis nevadensis TaxID=136037 RepID=A0A067RGW3_ZOONE|nr:reticulon-4-interacting protein 1 homolog, mitochondrial-like isoform X2 [Zootermopsis nevadensis]KDR22258.1 Reticulon-4-interacting protein 1-like protein, mitochondrial [Zootermopsis nevadensis]